MQPDFTLLVEQLLNNRVHLAGQLQVDYLLIRQLPVLLTLILGIISLLLVTYFLDLTHELEIKLAHVNLQFFSHFFLTLLKQSLDFLHLRAKPVDIALVTPVESVSL